MLPNISSLLAFTSRAALCLLLLLASFTAPTVFAQDAPQQPAPVEVSKERFEQERSAIKATPDDVLDAIAKSRFDNAIDTLEKSTTLTDDQKKDVLALITALETSHEKLKRELGLKTDFYAAKAEAENVRAAKKDAVDKESAVGESFFPVGTATELEADLENENTLLTAVKGDLTKLIAARDALEARKRDLPNQINGRNDRLETVAKDPEFEHRNGEPVAISDLRDWLLISRKRVIRVELEKLKTEQESIPVRFEVANYEVTLQERKKARVEARVEALRTATNRAKLKEVERIYEETKEKLQDAPTELRETADLAISARGENVELAGRIQSLAESRKSADASLKSLTSRLEYVNKSVAKGGSSETIGVILRRERRNLPDVTLLQAQAIARQDYLQDAQIRMIQIEEDLTRSELAEKEVRISNPELSDRIAEVFSSYRAGLKELNGAFETYLQQMRELEDIEHALIETRDELRQFIDEHVLWIRSTVLFGAADTVRAWKAILWFLDPHHLESVNLIRDLEEAPISAVLGYFLVLIFFLVSRPLRKRQETIHKIIENASAAPWRFTLQAWLAMIVRTLPWPLAMSVLAWRVSVLSSGTFNIALSTALYSAGATLFILSFQRRLCRKRGVAVGHFNWNPESLALFRRHIFWLTAIMVPCVFVSRLYSGEEVYAEFNNSLGRAAFVIQNLALMVFAHITLRPASVVMLGLKEKYLGRWIDRLGSIWYLGVVGTPFALAALAVWGYYYTAQELSGAVLRSVIALMIIMQINALVSRWFFLLTRRMAIRRAKARRRVAGLTQLSEQDIEADKLTAQDIKSLRNETRTLRRTFFLVAFFLWLYWIWSGILPAFNFFNTVEVWSYTASGGEILPVTLGSILSSLLIVVFTIAAVRVLPNLIEATILRRFNVDRGGRYAVKALTRYFLGVLGILFAFNSLGVVWGDVQWLVAGLSVGLGFGMQEIFANFISGLIMLFERPVRVGDTVTVGDISGTVMRINMRATTVLDWDRKELIVPNKMFVTDRMINWSLSDDFVRLKIPVGVAYGSNLELVRTTLLEVGSADKMVASDPAPTVYFKEFGDSTLNFELRVFVHGVDDYLRAKHNINTNIDRLFRERGIEIAFPQRVLHFASDANTLKLQKHQAVEVPVEVKGPEEVAPSPDDKDEAI